MNEATETDLLVSALLDSCCEQVLETMFFAPVQARTEPLESAGHTRLHTKLVFHGRPSGAFEVDTDPVVARAMAANFLGTEESEVSGEQVDDVLAEFSNMVCGSALSSLGCVEYFRLDAPHTYHAEAFQAEVEGVRRGFLLENGTLAVCLRVNANDE